ncbi:MAG: flagellar biosynthetic protein FliO [Candidatus Binatia bacterium]
MLSDFSGAVQFLVRWLSSSRRRAGEQALQLLESVPLTTHTSVALVRFEKEILLLGVTPQNVTVLATGVTQETAEKTQSKKNES